MGHAWEGRSGRAQEAPSGGWVRERECQQDTRNTKSERPGLEVPETALQFAGAEATGQEKAVGSEGLC